jgi:hypothetical protein
VLNLQVAAAVAADAAAASGVVRVHVAVEAHADDSTATPLLSPARASSRRSGGGTARSSGLLYGGEKVANRDKRAWHGATEKGP